MQTETKPRFIVKTHELLDHAIISYLTLHDRLSKGGSLFCPDK